MEDNVDKLTGNTLCSDPRCSCLHGEHTFEGTFPIKERIQFMSKPIDEARPLSHVNAVTCTCPAGKLAVSGAQLNTNLKAEHYSIALREESEARVAHAKALQTLAIAEEALNDATAQTLLARADLFKSCGL